MFWKRKDTHNNNKPRNNTYVWYNNSKVWLLGKENHDNFVVSNLNTKHSK